jgi:hypothetical protein
MGGKSLESMIYDVSLVTVVLDPAVIASQCPMKKHGNELLRIKATYWQQAVHSLTASWNIIGCGLQYMGNVD